MRVPKRSLNLNNSSLKKITSNNISAMARICNFAGWSGVALAEYKFTAHWAKKGQCNEKPN